MREHPSGVYDHNQSSATSSADSTPEGSEQHPALQLLRTKPYAVQARALKPGSSIQLDGASGAQSETEAVHQAASHGIQGGGGSMPHLGAIQQSFGSHDASSIQAHTGSAATQANEAMGAEAYATGNHVAFKETPDLHTAAHEAAHVVQQRSGVSLPGGVGSVGDSYEQHADAVADAVVAGQSAEGLLNTMSGGGESAVQERAVQKAGGAPPATAPGVPAYPFAHEEAPFAARLTSAGLANGAKIAELVYEGLALGGDVGKMEAAAALVPVPVVNPGQKLSFWSGWGCEAAAQASGQTTLDKVKLGKIGACLQSGDGNWQAKQPLWRAISRRFATVTRGECHAYIGFSKFDKRGGINPASVFAKAEKDEIDQMAAGHPEYLLSIKYHWVAAVHDIKKGKLAQDSSITGTTVGLPASTDSGTSPGDQSLYWVTGKAAHTSFDFNSNWVEKYVRDDGTEVKGHLRGV